MVQDSRSASLPWTNTSTSGRLPKRERIALWSSRSGLTWLLEILPQQPRLVVLNYHRIGDPTSTPYDPGTFSATTTDFDEQIGCIRKRHPILPLDEAVAIVEGREALTRTCVLITFDDGYLDNYQEAFPVLRSHGVPAVFFLPTHFIGTSHLQWWDVLAYVVKGSRHRRFSLAYPESQSFDLDQEGLAAVLRRMLLMAASSATTNADRFLSELEGVCDSSRPPQNTVRCYLSWDEAREMQSAGMWFGSHTHSHEILSKLPVDRQLEELAQSRRELEIHLGRSVESLAYPVGLSHTFTRETVDQVRAAGYRCAFSYFGGTNQPGQIDPFNIRRQGIMVGHSIHRFRLQTALSAVAGKWF